MAASSAKTEFAGRNRVSTFYTPSVRSNKRISLADAPMYLSIPTRCISTSPRHTVILGGVSVDMPALSLAIRAKHPNPEGRTLRGVIPRDAEYTPVWVGSNPPDLALTWLPRPHRVAFSQFTALTAYSWFTRDGDLGSTSVRAAICCLSGAAFFPSAVMALSAWIAM